MRGKPSYKRDKMEEKIMNDINMILRQETSDSRLQFVSITKVELATDNKRATVYWDTFDSSHRGDAKKAIEASAGRLRSHLARALAMRITPELNFIYDSQFEDENTISALLNAEAKAGKTF